MAVTDAQVHIWTVDPAAPKPDNPTDHQIKHPNGFTAEDLIAEMDAAGVDRAVICPPVSMMATATAYAKQSASRYPGRLAIMDQFGPRAPGARERLQTIRGEENVLGIRLGLRAILAQMEEGAVDWLWDDCERLGIPVTVLASGIPGRLLPVVQRHPNLR